MPELDPSFDSTNDLDGMPFTNQQVDLAGPPPEGHRMQQGWRRFARGDIETIQSDVEDFHWPSSVVCPQGNTSIQSETGRLKGGLVAWIDDNSTWWRIWVIELLKPFSDLYGAASKLDYHATKLSAQKDESA